MTHGYKVWKGELVLKSYSYCKTKRMIISNTLNPLIIMDALLVEYDVFMYDNFCEVDDAFIVIYGIFDSIKM